MKGRSFCMGLLLLLAGFALGQKIPSKEAIAIAMAQYPGTVIGAPTLHEWKNHHEWGIRVKSGNAYRDVFVNCETGKIDAVTPSHAGAPPLKVPPFKYTAEEAETIALVTYQGKAIGTPAYREWKGNRHVWGIRVKSGNVIRDVFVDVDTGKIDAAVIRK